MSSCFLFNSRKSCLGIEKIKKFPKFLLTVAHSCEELSVLVTKILEVKFLLTVAHSCEELSVLVTKTLEVKFLLTVAHSCEELSRERISYKNTRSKVSAHCCS